MENGEVINFRENQDSTNGALIILNENENQLENMNNEELNILLKMIIALSDNTEEIEERIKARLDNLKKEIRAEIYKNIILEKKFFVAVFLNFNQIIKWEVWDIETYNKIYSKFSYWITALKTSKLLENKEWCQNLWEEKSSLIKDIIKNEKEILQEFLDKKLIFQINKINENIKNNLDIENDLKILFQINEEINMFWYIISEKYQIKILEYSRQKKATSLILERIKKTF